MSNHPNRSKSASGLKMTVMIKQCGPIWFLTSGNLTLDLAVRVDRGYQIYEREKREGSHDYELAHKLRHLIGKRLVQAPKHDGQMTKAALIVEVEKALIA
jgi:hypothetical protein